MRIVQKNQVKVGPVRQFHAAQLAIRSDAEAGPAQAVARIEPRYAMPRLQVIPSTVPRGARRFVAVRRKSTRS
jgi:hypothetical protein